MSDVELPMRFESAHSVPKLFKFLHFVTSLLIAYDGPRAPGPISGDCINIIFFLMHKVILCSKVGIQTKYHASNMVGV